LRRTKRTVASKTPPKMEILVPCPLSKLQKTYYKEIILQDQAFLLPNNPSKIALRNIFLALRNVCNHPYFFAPLNTENMNDRQIMESLIEASGKLRLLDKMLTMMKKQNNRVLIYSQAIKNLNMVEDMIKWRNYSYERIDARTPTAERQAAIDRYNSQNGTFLFLISTRSGRFGLSLLSADTVIFCDSDFNPHEDSLAFSRVSHPTTQQNRVFIYRLYSEHTIEGAILQRTKNKLMLRRGVCKCFK